MWCCVVLRRTADSDINRPLYSISWLATMLDANSAPVSYSVNPSVFLFPDQCYARFHDLFPKTRPLTSTFSHRQNTKRNGEKQTNKIGLLTLLRAIGIERFVSIQTISTHKTTTTKTTNHVKITTVSHIIYYAFVYYACKKKTIHTACIPRRIRFTFTKKDLMLSECVRSTAAAAAGVAAATTDHN